MYVMGVMESTGSDVDVVGWNDVSLWSPGSFSKTSTKNVRNDNFISLSLLYPFTFWIPCCGVHFDFRLTSMFGSSLPPVGCWWYHVLFVLFVFLRVMVSNTYCAVFLLCFSLFSLPCVVSFSGLSIVDCSFGILWRVFTSFQTIHYVHKPIGKVSLREFTPLSTIFQLYSGQCRIYL